MILHALTFAGSRLSCLSMGPPGRVLKHLPRDPTSVDTIIIIIKQQKNNNNMGDRYSCIFYRIPIKIARTLNYYFLYI